MALNTGPGCRNYALVYIWLVKEKQHGIKTKNGTCYNIMYIKLSLKNGNLRNKTETKQ